MALTPAKRPRKIPSIMLCVPEMTMEMTAGRTKSRNRRGRRSVSRVLLCERLSELLFKPLFKLLLPEVFSFKSLSPLSAVLAGHSQKIPLSALPEQYKPLCYTKVKRKKKNLQPGFRFPGRRPLSDAGDKGKLNLVQHLIPAPCDGQIDLGNKNDFPLCAVSLALIGTAQPFDL